VPTPRSSSEMQMSLYSLYSYTSALFFAVCLFQLSITRKSYWWGAAALLLTVAWCCRPPFRLLWNGASWFRWGLVLLLVIQAGFGSYAKIAGNPRVGEYGVLVGALLLVVLPMNRFYRKLGSRE
jgi:hypothetical protein